MGNLKTTQELLTLFVQQPVGQLKAFVQQLVAQIEQELEMEIKNQLAGLKYEN